MRSWRNQSRGVNPCNDLDNLTEIGLGIAGIMFPEMIRMISRFPNGDRRMIINLPDIVEQLRDSFCSECAR